MQCTNQIDMKKVKFNRLKVIEKLISIHDKKQEEKRTYNEFIERYYRKERIDKIVAYQYFLTFREAIKKAVKERYLNESIEEISKSIIFFDIDGVNEFSTGTMNHYVHETEVMPLVENYVRLQFLAIDKNTLEFKF